MYDFLFSLIDFLFGWLPDTDSFLIPDKVVSVGGQILNFVGWIMPYNLYAPLLGFIISFVGFRIVYAIIIRVHDFSRR